MIVSLVMFERLPLSQPIKVLPEASVVGWNGGSTVAPSATVTAYERPSIINVTVWLVDAEENNAVIVVSAVILFTDLSQPIKPVLSSGIYGGTAVPPCST